MHKYENLPLYKQLSFIFLLLSHFIGFFFSHRNVDTYKIGRALLTLMPQDSPAGGDPSKYTEIKRGVVSEPKKAANCLGKWFLQEMEIGNLSGKELAIVNQHGPVHHQGWMICDQEPVFCWVPVPQLTMVVSSVALFTTYQLGRQ